MRGKQEEARQIEITGQKYNVAENVYDTNITYAQFLLHRPSVLELLQSGLVPQNETFGGY